MTVAVSHWGIAIGIGNGDSYLISASVIGTAASDHSSMAKIKMLSRHLEIPRNCFSFTNFVQIAFESYGPGVGRFVFLCCISFVIFSVSLFLLGECECGATNCMDILSDCFWANGFPLCCNRICLLLSQIWKCYPYWIGNCC